MTDDSDAEDRLLRCSVNFCLSMTCGAGGCVLGSAGGAIIGCIIMAATNGSYFTPLIGAGIGAASGCCIGTAYVMSKFGFLSRPSEAASTTQLESDSLLATKTEVTDIYGNTCV